MAWSRRRAAVRAKTLAACALVGLAIAGGARGDPPTAPAPRSIRDQAHAVVDAFDRGDTAEVARLAGEDRPDPWLVADLLCFAAKADAAAAYASAAPRTAVDRLPAYVAARRVLQEVEGARALSGRCVALLASGDHVGILAALEGQPTSQETAISVMLLRFRAEALQRLQRWPEARDAWAIVAERATRLGWWTHAALAANNGGYAADADLAWDDAAARYETAARLYADVRDRDGAAAALANLAAVQMRRGEPTRGAETARRALKLARELHADARELHVLTNLQECLRAQGDVVAALRVADERLEVTRRRADPRELLEGLLACAETYRDVHEVSRAQALLDEANALVRPDTPPRMRAEIRAVATRLAIDRGDFDRAERLARETLAIAEAIGDNDLAAVSLRSIGMSQRGAGRTRAAVETLSAARERTQRTASPREAILLDAALANALASDGKMAEAIGAFRRVRDGATQIADEARVAWCEWALAQALLATGEIDEALAVARSAAERLQALGSGLPEELLAGARRDVTGISDVGCRVAARKRDAAAFAFFVEASRANALRLALGGREALREAVIPAPLADAERRARAAEALAVTRFRAVTGRAPDEIASAATALEASRNAVRSTIERIRREAAAGAAVAHPVPDDLATLQRRLATDECLVLYAIEREAFALVISNDAARIVALAAPDELDAACANATAVLSSGAAPAAALDDLRRLAIEPLALPPSVRRVLVVPDGPLAAVPLGLVVGDREMAMLPSATTYGLLERDAARRGEGVLAVGEGSTAASRAHERTLPSAAKELASIGSVVLAGDAATEAEVRRVLLSRPRWSAVHFACHGTFDPERPGSSALELAADTTDDGRLSVMDAFRLDVRADLVVLAACETAKGRWLQGEGMYGLPRAFMAAGAPRVLASLWRVDDEATSRLMRAFHAAWARGDGVCEALRSAQAEIRANERWRHPRYWAAWVVWGLPR